MTIYTYLGLIASVLAGWFVIAWLLKARRARILASPLKSEWADILARNVPVYKNLPADLKSRLHGCINLFLKEKTFVGCEGLDVTDEMKITIAGNACLLILNNQTLNKQKKTFPGFTDILIYPHTYVAKTVVYDGMVETHTNETRAGESWHRGPVVLSWNNIINGSKHHKDGHNVVLHEFAHKLDEENGVVDGLPILRQSQHYKEWATVLTKEFESFTQRVEQGRNHVIDAYGAESGPEFFAVATESFFEKPKLMKRELPALYQQLERFYGLDPAQWHR